MLKIWKCYPPSYEFTGRREAGGQERGDGRKRGREKKGRREAKEGIGRGEKRKEEGRGEQKQGK